MHTSKEVRLVKKAEKDLLATQGSPDSHLGRDDCQELLDKAITELDQKTTMSTELTLHYPHYLSLRTEIMSMDCSKS